LFGLDDLNRRAGQASPDHVQTDGREEKDDEEHGELAHRPMILAGSR
jgi:hypothetical protein